MNAYPILFLNSECSTRHHEQNVSEDYSFFTSRTARSCDENFLCIQQGRERAVANLQHGTSCTITDFGQPEVPTIKGGCDDIAPRLTCDV